MTLRRMTVFDPGDSVRHLYEGWVGYVVDRTTKWTASEQQTVYTVAWDGEGTFSGYKAHDLELAFPRDPEHTDDHYVRQAVEYLKNGKSRLRTIKSIHNNVKDLRRSVKIVDMAQEMLAKTGATSGDPSGGWWV